MRRAAWRKHIGHLYQRPNVIADGSRMRRDAATEGPRGRDLIVADIVARTGIDEAMIERLVRSFLRPRPARPATRPNLRRHRAGLGTAYHTDLRVLVVGRADERP